MYAENDEIKIDLHVIPINVYHVSKFMGFLPSRQYISGQDCHNKLNSLVHYSTSKYFNYVVFDHKIE